MRAKQKMQDVSSNIYQAIVVPLVLPEKTGTSVHPTPFKIWELSEKALKKHDIID